MIYTPYGKQFLQLLYGSYSRYHEINKTCLTQNLKNDAGGQLLSLSIIVIQVIKDFIKTYKIGIFNL